jgi:hypothetical protein
MEYEILTRSIHKYRSLVLLIDRHEFFIIQQFFFRVLKEYMKLRFLIGILYFVKY